MSARQWIGLIPLAALLFGYLIALLFEVAGFCATAAGEWIAKKIDGAGESLARWVNAGGSR